MKIGDVITYKDEHGVIEKIYGSDAHVRFFRKKFDLDLIIPIYSHEIAQIDLFDYYKNRSFLNYCKYFILQILYDIKRDFAFGLFVFCVIGIITMVMFGIFIILSNIIFPEVSKLFGV